MQRRACFDLAEPAKPRDPNDSGAGNLHVLPFAVCQDIDAHSELGHDECSIVDAERRAAFGEERLRSDHERSSALRHANTLL